MHERPNPDAAPFRLVGFDGYVESPELASQRKVSIAAANKRRFARVRAASAWAKRAATSATPSPSIRRPASRPAPSRSDLVATILRQQAAAAEAKLKAECAAVLADERRR
jgi:hypothetical protein